MAVSNTTRRMVALPGRLARSGCRLSLHLPEGWPWEEQFMQALVVLRGVRLTV